MPPAHVFEQLSTLPAATDAEVRGDVVGPLVLISEGWPARLEWQIPVEVLLQHTAALALRSEPIELPLQDPAGPASVTLRLQTFTTDGSVSMRMSLPMGTRARWAHWLGPLRKSPRVLTDTWDKEDRFFGSHDCGRVADHAENGLVRLGFSLLVCTPPAGLAKAPATLQVGERIGEGSFGTVWLAHDTGTGRQDLVVKQSSRGDKSNFDAEAVAIRTLAECPGFPELIGYFEARKDCSQEILVIAKLHRNLESLRCDPAVGPKERLSPETVAGIGIQLITRLQDMHERDLIHMDLKPENIMIGPGKGDIVYLIDFGLMRHWRVMGAHVPGKRANLRGTARYCSVHAHQGLRSRRADMEALAYVLIYLAIGHLPWQGAGAGNTKKFRYDKTLETKLEAGLLERFTREGLPNNLPLADALVEMARSCLLLKFEEAPNYDLLRSSLEDWLPAGREGISFDWMAKDGGLTPAAALTEGDPSASSASSGVATSVVATRGNLATTGNTGGASEHGRSRATTPERGRSGESRGRSGEHDRSNSRGSRGASGASAGRGEPSPRNPALGGRWASGGGEAGSYDQPPSSSVARLGYKLLGVDRSGSRNSSIPAQRSSSGQQKGGRWKECGDRSQSPGQRSGSAPAPNSLAVSGRSEASGFNSSTSAPGHQVGSRHSSAAGTPPVIGVGDRENSRNSVDRIAGPPRGTSEGGPKRWQQCSSQPGAETTGACDIM